MSSRIITPFRIGEVIAIGASRITYPTVRDAYLAWSRDSSIHTLCWDNESGSQQKWFYHIKKEMTDNTENLLCRISENYRDTVVGSEWWVRMNNLNIIQEVTPKDSFFHRFCT